MNDNYKLSYHYHTNIIESIDYIVIFVINLSLTKVWPHPF